MAPSAAAAQTRAARLVAAVRGSRRLRADSPRTFGPISLALVAVVLGVAAGLGAFVFRALIAVVHNLSFFGRLSLEYDTSQHAGPSPFGVAVVLAPMGGAVVVVFLVKNFAPEAKGHGVPEVMDAIYYGKSVIRPVVAAVKSLASAISIGSGGSVGREGPIVQISAAFASWLGGFARVSRWQRATLVAAGGGAGIAATFNTPIGGVLFAVEVLLPEVSVRTLVPVALATATATYVGQRLFGTSPAFVIPTVHASESVAVLPAYVALGGAMAVIAVVFIRGLYATEDLFDRTIRRNEYLRHVVGMLGVGVTMVLLMRLRGHYYVEGVGYATIVDILTGGLTGAGFLVVLFVLKLMTTLLTLGSGGSGGVFSPSLFMGATLGGAFGLVLKHVFPGIPFDPAALALAGMAGLIAGATGAALTAIVMIFEMTLDYSVVLPMTLTVAVSHGARRMLLAQNIYTMKLARRGHYMPEALQANAHLVHHVGDVKMATAVVRDATATCASVVGEVPATTADYVVVVERDEVRGVATMDAVRHAATEAGRTLGALEHREFVVVPTDMTLFDLLGSMQRRHADVAVVRVGGKGVEVAGVLTALHLNEALAEGMEIFGD